MSDDELNITVDGKPLKARRGQMLIEVTDAAGIDVPRFCYHKKLSVAANYRMCLVEVEKAPKPLPACATPVMPDMVVHTTSKLARDAQKGTMEFLLINHPLDCPICDQGGECELQDLAMGYGGGASQYTEGKRVVFDKYIGPLIATEMTRCIHCTRCVRFGEEVAGIRELGATGRGENVRIGTYIEKSVASEVSGNVIDICPVGALTARPSRFTARSWELQQQASVAPHDSVGSNVYVHLDGSRVNRVIPRENESINEVWISDRDRFSYQGLRSEDRLTAPMIRLDGKLQPTDWPTALAAAAAQLQGAGSGTASNAGSNAGASAGASAAENLGVLVSPSSSVEELYLTQKLARALSTPHIDHRLSQVDFRGQDTAPVMPWLGMPVSDLENLDAALLIGSNIRKDQPIAAVRLRKSALKGGSISFLNPRAFPLHFEAADARCVRYDHMVSELATIARAAGTDLPDFDSNGDAGSNRNDDQKDREAHQRIADSLRGGNADDAGKGSATNQDAGDGDGAAAGGRRVIFLGNLAVQHPDYATLQYLAGQLARATGATLAMLPERANTAGAWLAGAVPHRGPGGASVAPVGKSARDMFEQPMQRYLLVGCEPEFDAANPAQAVAALEAASAVVSISAFLSDSLREHADVVLPMATFPETWATFVNASGVWQSVRGASLPPGEARPAWKIFRVLADALELEGFAVDSPETITRELQQQCASVELNNLTESRAPEATHASAAGQGKPGNGAGGGGAGALLRAGETPIHTVDALVRRSQPLQKSFDGKQAFATMAAGDCDALSLQDGDTVSLRQNGATITLPVKRDDAIPAGCVWLPGGLVETRTMGDLYGAIEVSRS